MYKMSPHATLVNHDLLPATECFANICVTLWSHSSNQSQGPIMPVTVLPVTEWLSLHGIAHGLPGQQRASAREGKERFSL